MKNKNTSKAEKELEIASERPGSAQITHNVSVLQTGAIMHMKNMIGGVRVATTQDISVETAKIHIVATRAIVSQFVNFLISGCVRY